MAVLSDQMRDLPQRQRRPIYSSDSRIIDETGVAQEAYGLLKFAIDIIGMLNTAIDESQMTNKKDVVQPSNPFDNIGFVDHLKRLITDFAMLTDSSQEVVNQLLNLMDADLAHGKYFEAQGRVTDLFLYFMNQTMKYFKRKYPW